MKTPEIIDLANKSGIDTDSDGDIYGSTLGALLVFAKALRRETLSEATGIVQQIEMGGQYLPFKYFAIARLHSLVELEVV